MGRRYVDKFTMKALGRLSRAVDNGELTTKQMLDIATIDFEFDRTHSENIFHLRALSRRVIEQATLVPRIGEMPLTCVRAMAIRWWLQKEDRANASVSR